MSEQPSQPDIRELFQIKGNVVGAHEKFIDIFKTYCPGRSSGSAAPSFVYSSDEGDG